MTNSTVPSANEISSAVKAVRWLRHCYLLRTEQAHRRFGMTFYDFMEAGEDFEIRFESDAIQETVPREIWSRL
jgi:hypothetical protein